MLMKRFTCRAFGPDMVKRNKGHIVEIASMSSFLGVGVFSDYSACKLALVSFTESELFSSPTHNHFLSSHSRHLCATISYHLESITNIRSPRTTSRMVRCPRRSRHYRPPLIRRNQHDPIPKRSNREIYRKNALCPSCRSGNCRSDLQV